jgi:protein-disulfide isomerase
MSDLGSAPIPGVSEQDHVRGPSGGRTLIVYADFECPFCAALDMRLQGLHADRVVFRHFPVRSSHPRAWPAACAVEAAGLQGRFWEMHDALFADPARLEDPHLWERARRLELELDRFDRDRRGDAVRDRVKRDFRSGVRGGVVTTPAIFELGDDGAVIRLDREQFGPAPGSASSGSGEV